MPVTRSCDHCGTTYTRPPALAGKYCSSACGYAARRKDQTRGYRMLYRPGHPIATRSPYIPEHRVLLWEKIGPGTHPCHYCQAKVSWKPGSKTARGSLTVDHLDRDKTNNDPENLVPCCQRCNSRNIENPITPTESHRVRVNGSRVRGETRACETCGGDFVAWPDSRPNRGRYCSRSCARSKPSK